jgi:uncharacterized protein
MDSNSQAYQSLTSPHSINPHAIDGQALKQLTEAGLVWLKANQQIVNALNVFPVPDGDTGTNMVLTMQSAFSEIVNSSERNTGKVAHSIAHGALMGARGNSGVILSQLWRGFARALDHQKYLDAQSLARAFAEGRDTAYKGVVRPVEGTILTVAKDAAAAAEKICKETDNPFEALAYIVEEAEKSVERTPELLPLLKDAGVVDSGGKGLFYIFEGMLRYINNQPLDVALPQVQPLPAIRFEETVDAIEPGQDYEIVVDFKPSKPLKLEEFYQNLEQMGTSIQLGEGEGIYRLHIHVPTEKRYEPIEYTMSLGTITKVAIENLMAQMEELERSRKGVPIAFQPVKPDGIATIAVAPGSGIARVFASLGVSAVVEGGQTMNPSTQEIIQAFDGFPTEKIIILPNNKNVILAAETASQLSNKQIAVIPTRTVPQGLAAMLRWEADGDFDEIVQKMNEAMLDVDTGEITTATRNVEINGLEVREGQIIALHNGKLVLGADDIGEACLKLLEFAKAEDHELITLFYGENISKGEVEEIEGIIGETYPNLEIEVQEGGQPHYFFIISIE